MNRCPFSWGFHSSHHNKHNSNKNEYKSCLNGRVQNMKILPNGVCPLHLQTHFQMKNNDLSSFLEYPGVQCCV